MSTVSAVRGSVTAKGFEYSLPLVGTASAQIGPTPIGVVAEEDNVDTEYAKIAADGSAIVFEAGQSLTPSAGGGNVYVYDVATDSLEQVDVNPAGPSESPVGRETAGDSSIGVPDISADGGVLQELAAQDDTPANAWASGWIVAPTRSPHAAVRYCRR